MLSGSGKKMWELQRIESCAWGRRTTSGRWGRRARVAPAPKSISTGAKLTGVENRTAGSAAPATGMELWNLVFMEFDRQKEGALKPLAARGVDTGMGLERMASVLQGAETNYHTDLLRPILEEAARETGTVPSASPQSDVSLRVITDHIRAVTFLIADGVIPANDGRGYVLRRILRRAIRHGRMLGKTKPFLHKIGRAHV